MIEPSWSRATLRAALDAGRESIGYASYTLEVGCGWIRVEITPLPGASIGDALRLAGAVREMVSSRLALGILLDLEVRA